MRIRLNSFALIIAVFASFLSSCQKAPSPSESEIVGLWVGQSQWNCGHGDPPWATKLEFRSDGTFESTMTLLNQPDSTSDGVWTVVDDRIEMKFSPTSSWSGEISGNKMEGTLGDTRDPSCTGTWSLVRQ